MVNGRVEQSHKSRLLLLVLKLFHGGNVLKVEDDALFVVENELLTLDNESEIILNATEFCLLLNSFVQHDI